MSTAVIQIPGQIKEVTRVVVAILNVLFMLSERNKYDTYHDLVLL